jgi:uncharacterized protein YndB with AHSA1/START domain
MPEASRSIRINRPREEVFAFFADASNDRVWRRHLLTIEGPSKPRAGARIHETFAGPGHREVPADFEITAWEPPLRYSFTVLNGPVRPHCEFGFDAAGAGTEVTLRLVCDVGGLRGFLSRSAVRRALEAEVAGLDLAKQALEAAETG